MIMVQCYCLRIIRRFYEKRLGDGLDGESSANEMQNRKGWLGAVLARGQLVIEMSE